MRIRLLLAKIGIDGHDRGIRTLAYALRDAGIEVVYTGPWQKVEAVIATAIQEDVDLIGISTLGGDHILVPKLVKQLKQKGVEIPVIVGGIVPMEDEIELKKAGVTEVFHPGASMESIVAFIKSQAESVQRKRHKMRQNSR